MSSSLLLTNPLIKPLVSFVCSKFHYYLDESNCFPRAAHTVRNMEKNQSKLSAPHSCLSSNQKISCTISPQYRTRQTNIQSTDRAITICRLRQGLIKQFHFALIGRAVGVCSFLELVADGNLDRRRRRRRRPLPVALTLFSRNDAYFLRLIFDGKIKTT